MKEMVRLDDEAIREIIDKLIITDVSKEMLRRFCQNQMVDILNAEEVNVVIGELGHHLWVCTENGTILRAKAKNITLDDRRLKK